MPAFSQGKSLTLSMLAGYKEDVLRANLPEFEKKTGIKVVVDAAPFGDLYKKQLLSLSTAAAGTTSSSWTSRGFRRSRSSSCRSPSG